MDYDVFIAGGGIAGSTAARFAAKAGLKTLFIERHKTPRNKPCSGIQFGYFEKMLGVEVPRERLCNYELKKIKIYLPNGKSFGSPLKMLNFMRKPFDDWLNIIAQEEGAEFQDECVCQKVEEKEDHNIVTLVRPNEKKTFEIKAKYVLDATGLRPRIRSQIRPHNTSSGFEGATLNYYIDGDSDLDPETLYQFWNLDWNNAMFAWIYTKTLDDGKDYWVVGTGYNNDDINKRQTMFYESMKEQFNINGEIVKREGYKTSMDMYAKDRVWLGQNKILMVGDAAGLIDLVRGVGMDAAAMSGRIAARAIAYAEKKNTSALSKYTKLMRRITSQTIKNQQREINVFKSNEELQRYMDKSMMKTGMKMMYQSQLNKFRSGERQVLLPP